MQNSKDKAGMADAHQWGRSFQFGDMNKRKPEGNATGQRGGNQPPAYISSYQRGSKKPLKAMNLNENSTPDGVIDHEAKRKKNDNEQRRSRGQNSSKHDSRPGESLMAEGSRSPSREGSREERGEVPNQRSRRGHSSTGNKSGNGSALKNRDVRAEIHAVENADSSRVAPLNYEFKRSIRKYAMDGFQEDPSGYDDVNQVSQGEVVKQAVSD